MHVGRWAACQVRCFGVTESIVFAPPHNELFGVALASTTRSEKRKGRIALLCCTFHEKKKIDLLIQLWYINYFCRCSLLLRSTEKHITIP